MTQQYADRYGVSDHSAANNGIIINQGNDFADVLQFVNLHEAGDGSSTETPIDISGHVFESEIKDGSGITVARFTFTHEADTSSVKRSLDGTITETMAVGSYAYHIDTISPELIRKTRLNGNLEILPRAR